MHEVLSYNAEEIASSLIIEQECLKPKEYIIVSVHREENIDNEENFKSIIDSIYSIAERYNKKIIVSTHPRTRIKLEKIRFVNQNSLISFMKPFGFFEYIKLQENAFCVVSDSGTITEESSLLKFPAVTIRQSHERPEGMDEGTVIMTGLNKESILNAIYITTERFKLSSDPFKTVNDYKADYVSQKVLNTILSYTDFINRTVWLK